MKISEGNRGFALYSLPPYKTTICKCTHKGGVGVCGGGGGGGGGGVEGTYDSLEIPLTQTLVSFISPQSSPHIKCTNLFIIGQ